MLYLIKRLPGEAMLATGVCLVISATCWADLIDKGTLNWDLDRTPGFGLWFSRNGLPVMFILSTLSAISGVLFLICGAWRIIRDR